jgi:hypothetical protein
MVNRIKEKINEVDKNLYCLPDIVRLISDKHVAQMPKKFSYNIERQKKTEMEMRVNGVN